MFKKFVLLFSAVITLSQITAQERNCLKTPKKYFENLKGYSFKENFIEIENGMFMHYVDEGNKNSPVVLLVHGEPAWSYSYRNIIPSLTKKGYRVIAPDLIGFGKSDKPAEKAAYTYSNHTQWLGEFISKLKLEKIHCYAHDWGAMLILRIVAKQPELFSKVAISYGFLFTGEEKIPESFYSWQKFSQEDSAFQAGTIVNWGTCKELPKEVQDAYNAPFPSEKYKTGIRQFPVLVPLISNYPEAIKNKMLREKLKLFNKPFLTIWGNTKDEVWMDKDVILQNETPGAQGLEHKVLNSNHFIQEDKEQELTEILINFFSAD